MWLGVACGPQLTPISGHDDGEGSTSASTSATTSTGSGSTTIGEPGTTAVDGTTSMPDTGVAFLEPTIGGCETESGGGGLAECDVWAQDCCFGDKCVAWANDGGSVWNATRCSAVSPEPHAPGEPCTVEGSGVSGLDDCDATSYCWNVPPGELMGECVAMCQGSPDAPECPAGSDCIIANDGVLILCFEQCDPLAPDCGEGQSCVWIEGAPHCIQVGPSEASVGDPCESQVTCNDVGYCVAGATFPGCAAAGCCSPFCSALEPEGDAACMALDASLGCTPLYEPGRAPPGLEHLGACTTG